MQKTCQTNQIRCTIHWGYASGNLEIISRVAVVHLNFLAGSTFLVPVCTVPSSMDRTSNKVNAVRL